MGGKVLEPEFLPCSPDDSRALVEFSSQVSMALQTTPGAVVATWSVVTVWSIQRPPRLLNVSSVSPLHSSRPLPSLPPGNAASLVLVVFWWETQAPSLWSLLVHHPLPQLPGRGQMTMPSRRTWWHMFKLPDKGPCKPFIPLKSFLPPCIELT